MEGLYWSIMYVLRKLNFLKYHTDQAALEVVAGLIQPRRRVYFSSTKILLDFQA